MKGLLRNIEPNFPDPHASHFVKTFHRELLKGSLAKNFGLDVRGRRDSVDRIYRFFLLAVDRKIPLTNRQTNFFVSLRRTDITPRTEVEDLRMVLNIITVSHVAWNCRLSVLPRRKLTIQISEHAHRLGNES
jgi:hypothetical protein